MSNTLSMKCENCHKTYFAQNIYLEILPLEELMTLFKFTTDDHGKIICPTCQVDQVEVNFEK